MILKVTKTECVLMKIGSDTPDIIVARGDFHSLEATDEVGVICSVKADNFEVV